jgi:two-component system response regulator RegA
MVVAGLPSVPSLLLVDDDAVFCEVLTNALSKRGFAVTVAHDAMSAQAHIGQLAPAFAIVDLQMPGPSGLEVVAALHQRLPDCRIVVLTGFASIATAVEAIKLGATYYLTKPADTDEILAAFERDRGDTSIDLAEHPMSVNRIEWEHIHKVLGECDGNVSEAARRLGMHRRTLQRKLRKKPVRR